MQPAHKNNYMSIKVSIKSQSPPKGLTIMTLIMIELTDGNLKEQKYKLAQHDIISIQKSITGSYSFFFSQNSIGVTFGNWY